MDREEKLRELQALRAKAAALEVELAFEQGRRNWTPKGYYATYHVLAGMVLGFVAASASLLFNVVGSVMIGQHPLQLIRVYLTFPMGAAALELDSGFSLAAGCCLYLGTGMIGGIPFHLILSKYFAEATSGKRFIVATILGVGVWLINFYGVINWLQPALIGGRWILDEIPVWVALLTHLIFAWTMLLVDQWGQFVRERPNIAEAGAA